ncbi:MAG: DNA recombination protein RmuC [Candidatus Marinimicrobia bacterium]|nr:DNA recombination protein RmuC [Candidatus Neomarinimicrobiota bacterium]
MDVAIIILLTMLIALAGLLVFMLVGRRSEPDKLEAAMGRNFLQFQQHIQETMQTTRQEVERSKDVLSENAIKTLKMLNDMGKTIQDLVRQQEDAQEIGESLKNLLQPPTLRGSYGEQILEEMLDRILPRGIWESQYSIESGLRVDAVVKFKDVVIPIDAKFPRDDYERYLRAEDVDDQKAHWKSFEEAMKRQIKSISDKYVKPELGTTNFALMFIPSDAIYYEAIAESNQLGELSSIPEYAEKMHVFAVSPATFFAFLQILILGIRNVEIMENARNLQQGLAKLERNFDLFFKKFQEVGKGIDKATEAYRVGEGHIDKFRRDLETTLALDLPAKEPPALDEGDSS